MTKPSTRSIATLGGLAALCFAAGCAEEKDFFPDDDQGAGTGGAHAGTGGESTAGTNASAGTGGSAGAGGGSGGAAGALGGAAGSSAGVSSGGSPQAGAGAGGTAGAAAGSFSGSENGGSAGRAGDASDAGEAGALPAEGGTNGVGGSSAGKPGTGGGAGAGTGGGGTTGEGGEAGANCTPATELCNGIDDDCNNAVDEANVCPTGCSAKSRDDRVYLLCVAPNETEGADYPGARTRCDSFGETLGLGVDFALVRVESAPENDFLKAWLGASITQAGTVFHAANDLADENTWVWGNDAPSDRFFTERAQGGGSPYMNRFNDFADGRPNGSAEATEDCGAFDSEFAWQWNDIICERSRLGFLCEQTP